MLSYQLDIAWYLEQSNFRNKCNIFAIYTATMIKKQSTQALSEQFTEIYDAYARELLGFSFQKTSDKAIAEDIVADTFSKLWKKMSEGENIENPRALLYTIIRSLIIDQYRKNSIRQTIPIDEVVETLVSEGMIEMKIDLKKSYAQIMEIFQEIKQEYSDILILHYVQELSISEISEILGETENNLRVRLHRALGAVRKKLDYER